MKNDAATSWVSPLFFDAAAYWGVTVLNPSGSSAEVTVTFYVSKSGMVAEREVRHVDPGHAERFEYQGNQYGWVHVKADQPIFPTGYTMAPPIYNSIHPSDIRYFPYVPMTFNRAEGIEPPEYVLIDKDLLPDDLDKLREG